MPKGNQSPPPGNLDLRSDCSQGSSSRDIAINNVRARLLIAGDCWWDLSSRARYVVPKVPLGSGLPEVSSLFAGAVWLGGKDPAGNLKLAAQTYRTNTRTDFWPGPLDTVGNTNKDQCKRWDRHFTVLGQNIRKHIGAFEEAKAAGLTYDCSNVPEDILGWPARGNPHFFNINGFNLPNTTQGLALFYDEDGDGLYDPCKGDYPVIDIRGCELKEYPDEMVFWIYNDNGGIHTQSVGSVPIRMEVQVQAFAYTTNDQLNDMTFMRYKLINRAIEILDSTFFAVWTDPDLGCYLDDYIACDTSRSLAICYNQDDIDGNQGANCDGGVPTYGTKVPIIGIDYFRGPRDTYKPILDGNGNPVLDPYTGLPTFEEIGMTSFTYYVNGGFPGLPPTSDPQAAQEYYNLMQGKWRNGVPLTYGGNGYDPNNQNTTNYAFTDLPNIPGGWSMCALNLPGFDGRTVQASGPFKLDPGAINELIIGLPWVSDQDYPCPPFDEIFEADDLSQALFDNCFKITDGPDAPDVELIELDREIILVLSNGPSSNNFKESYKEVDLKAPTTQPDTLYKFEGYIIYQLRDPTVGTDDFTNPQKAVPIFQVDLKNKIKTIYNWKGVNVGLDQPAFVPELMVSGADRGIVNTFRVTQDAFASGDNRTLINHKKYYFAAIAYAHNNWSQFDPSTGTGQANPYLSGRFNIGDSKAGTLYYTGIPRPITDRVMRASYGTGDVQITRLEGVGTFKNFIDVTDATRESFLQGNNGTIPYINGRGPITVSIYNPLDIKDGEFELTFRDGNMNDTKLDDTTRWVLKRLNSSDPEVISASTIKSLNEQLLTQYGFSVSIAQGNEPGDNPFFNEDNGFIGVEVDYREAKAAWLNTFTDGPNILDFMRTGPSEQNYGMDPEGIFSNPGNLFVPYQLCSWSPPSGFDQIITPAWQNANSSTVRDSLKGLSRLNNVDIVFTRDKSKWSRCIVVETTPAYFIVEGFTTAGGAANFDVRKAPSVGKDDSNNDGLPDPDGALENMAPLVGQPLTGMSWFPGYAVDVETGERLNIFFGEASVFNKEKLDEDGFNGFFDQDPNSIGKAHDMLWNPTSFLQSNFGGPAQALFSTFLGGHHYIYVTDQKYDGCDSLRTRLDPKFGSSLLRKVAALRRITWTAFPYLPLEQRMLSLNEGLIPNELVVKLRVEKKYAHRLTASSVNNGYPTYRIKFDGVQALPLDDAGKTALLNNINVVPNPYYGYSPYEISQFTTTVKITNLPPVCTVNIYSLDGKFIKQFKRQEAASNDFWINAPIGETQYTPALEWDLRNSRNIPVASGVYLIHVDAPGIGQRTLKWFGTNRQFDPSGL